MNGKPTPVFFPSESHGQRGLPDNVHRSLLSVKHKWSNLTCSSNHIYNCSRKNRRQFYKFNASFIRNSAFPKIPQPSNKLPHVCWLTAVVLKSHWEQENERQNPINNCWFSLSIICSEASYCFKQDQVSYWPGRWGRWIFVSSQYMTCSTNLTALPGILINDTCTEQMKIDIKITWSVV